jgi:hypothetical protein
VRYVLYQAYALSGLLFFTIRYYTGRCPVLLLMPFQGKLEQSIPNSKFSYHTKQEKTKMPLRLQNTKTHKEQTISILYLVNSLSLRAFVANKLFRLNLYFKLLIFAY